MECQSKRAFLSTSRSLTSQVISLTNKVVSQTCYIIRFVNDFHSNGVLFCVSTMVTAKISGLSLEVNRRYDAISLYSRLKALL